MSSSLIGILDSVLGPLGLGEGVFLKLLHPRVELQRKRPLGITRTAHRLGPDGKIGAGEHSQSEDGDLRPTFLENQCTSS